MVQLRIISGKLAGDVKVVRHFPFRIGRAPENDLCLDDSGIWDNHLTLDFQKGEGILLQAAPEAFSAVNDEAQTVARLRNGDVISFGSTKIQFWMAAPRQRPLHLGELSVWFLIAGITAVQVLLILQLLKK
jgi:pSer/pThr/pTyr-binding forkhead associated (FHA) protein